MNTKEELDCQLDCKATAGLRKEGANDLTMEDKPLEELLNEQTAKSEEHPKNSSREL